MSLKRLASAVWKGTLKEGTGLINAQTGVLRNVPYTFNSRFLTGDQKTNPEELIAAAHASCFSMAVSNQLGQLGFKPESLSTKATVNMAQIPPHGWTVTDITLDLTAKVPHATEEQIQKAAADAKAGCPISRLLNTNIELNVKVEQ